MEKVSSDTSENRYRGTTICLPRWEKPRIRVKFMSRGDRSYGAAASFIRQFPGGIPQWGNCLFDFDNSCRDYDWLVVYHDLPKSDSFLTEEKLACPQERTILITTEPSTIAVFGRDYLNQFGCILTFQEPWAIKHPNPVFHHPGLMWYYGLSVDRKKFITWDQIAAAPPPQKKELISTVCSAKTGKTTLHTTRVDFTWKLKEEIPELDIYGHGVKNMYDKAEALDHHKFHIAIENHVFNHHITEKLPDVFLGYALPFYHGAPNAADYFPKESFIPIDINDYKRARDIIKSHLANNEYEDRLPYIIEARKRVIEEQNLFALLDRNITEQNKKISTETMGKVIRNRPTMRMVNPLAGVRSLTEKAMVKMYHRMTFSSRNKPKDV